MELASKYNPADVEGKWYQYWLDHKLFSSKPDGREPYTVVIPPPNVTGVLHMGHMLNNTIQDILVRRARMEGKNACWVPGTDHASIATEAKVVNKLAEQGIKKTDLTRDEFLKHAWEWTDEHGGIILKQLRKLGASCDWDRTAFTMDEKRSESVLKVFVDLYNKGLIYRGVRMVNWDPKALTALSDEEVIYKEEHSKLYYLKYMVEGDPEGRYAVVATTRPETIMGDTAMCINPNDPKNTWLKGKKVIVPLVGRVIPVIEDDYVDIEFGTGCLKVTPAHDVNDYMLGEKYNLPSIDIFNDNGTLSEAAGLYIGMDRFDVREQIEKDLAAAGLLEKVEAYTNKVGFSERTNVPIEPKLSMQWFLKMQHFADMALPPVMNDELKFYPAKYKNTYKNWLENIKDWCISRQLWWGHRIPAYFLPEGGYVVAATPEEALALAKEKTGNAGLKQEDLRQDEDCLDTWFSSWLWPISLFDGINNPGNEEISYYYPTSDLVTGPDIIFFWVARMIMAGYEYEGKMPFKNVYFTGIVRDKLGRKMSKSLGNSPDPLDLIEKYGADAVRMGMMLSAPAGNDIFFDNALCEQGRNFNNKIWNAFRLIKGWEVDVNMSQPKVSKVASTFFENALSKSIKSINKSFEKYRLSEALREIYRLFWDDFSGKYLELVKPEYGKPIDYSTYSQVLSFFKSLLKLLHPFIPFITEELWHNMEGNNCSIMLQQVPVRVKKTPNTSRYDKTFEWVSAIRKQMSLHNMSNRDSVKLVEIVTKNKTCNIVKVILEKLINIDNIKNVNSNDNKDLILAVSGSTACYIDLGVMIDVAAELAKLEEDLKYQEGFLESVQKKLSNVNFVNKAPANVVEIERKKLEDAQSKIASLKFTIDSLNKTKSSEAYRS
ncbi:valine--tRNA ligase [Bacteroides uniformis]|uniref:Valine--tRNA ligase n=1 Tax=Bacteroides uniformis TaxID=820 RepID=A0AA37JW05_BACUN|nr:valine--tRNA ligase [Bacteroides uniformis]GKH15492.1 valine--tRNA ligase [Bacteroides uniformis]GKH38831.1 valine--tRNA ligase [Bacteroides uniformis]